MAVILLVSCGAMGAALGQLLVLSGHKVLFPAAKRSALTLDRAKAAGIQAIDQDLELLWSSRGHEIELILSILPPSEALRFAQEIQQLASTDSRDRIFVDLNAISPDTAGQINRVLLPCKSLTYINGSIIGMPPRFEDAASPSLDTLVHNPCIYLSTTPESHHHQVQVQTMLHNSGWKVRAIAHDENDTTSIATAAKALKLCYSSIAKGMMALATTAALTSTSTSPAVSQALATELCESLPGFATFISKQMQHVVPKSARFVGEMHEIAALTQSATSISQVGDVWNSIAYLYDHIGEQRGTSRGDEIDHQLSAFGSQVRQTLDKIERE